MVGSSNMTRRSLRGGAKRSRHSLRAAKSPPLAISIAFRVNASASPSRRASIANVTLLRVPLALPAGLIHTVLDRPRCCAIATATRHAAARAQLDLLMPVTTPARYRLGSATRTSSTRFAISSLRRTGSRTSGAEKRDVEKRAESLLNCMASGGPTEASYLIGGNEPPASSSQPEEGSLRRYEGKSQDLSAAAALFSALLARRVGQCVGFATPKILAA
jgi:hypothetical protein